MCSKVDAGSCGVLLTHTSSLQRQWDRLEDKFFVQVKTVFYINTLWLLLLNKQYQYSRGEKNRLWITFLWMKV